MKERQLFRIVIKNYDSFCLFVFEGFRPTRKFFTYKETPPLPVKDCKFWHVLGSHDHRSVKVYLLWHGTSVYNDQLREPVTLALLPSAFATFTNLPHARRTHWPIAPTNYFVYIQQIRGCKEKSHGPNCSPEQRMLAPSSTKIFHEKIFLISFSGYFYCINVRRLILLFLPDYANREIVSEFSAQ